MARPPFSMLRAAFYLLASVVLIEMVETLFTLLGCWWLLVVGTFKPGECAGAGTLIHEVFSEVLTAVLALLLAARSDPPPPRPPPEEPNER